MVNIYQLAENFELAREYLLYALMKLPRYALDCDCKDSHKDSWEKKVPLYAKNLCLECGGLIEV